MRQLGVAPILTVGMPGRSNSGSMSYFLLADFLSSGRRLLLFAVSRHVPVKVRRRLQASRHRETVSIEEGFRYLYVHGHLIFLRFRCLLKVSKPYFQAGLNAPRVPERPNWGPLCS